MMLRDLFQIRNGITFLNHGSFGACPVPVFQVYRQWQQTLEEQPVEFLGRRLNDLLAGARAPLAAYVGTDPQNIVFVPNATYGVNVVARSLDLGHGDEVLASDHEYGASDRTWRFLAKERGFTYINHPIPVPIVDVDSFIETFWQGVTPRTKVIFLSHITSPTAVTFPIEQICERARKAGILTVIDGAHAPGQVDLALDTLAVDFYTGNCHKWLCAPKGSAFLYAHPAAQHLLKPLVVSWGYESHTPSDSRFQDLFGWTGTSDPAAYLSVPAAIAFQQEHNWSQVRVQAHELVRHVREEMTAMTTMPPIVPDSPKWYGQMMAFPLQIADGPAFQQRLYEEFQIEIPVFNWNNQPYLRISVQGYTTSQDVEVFLHAMRQVL